MNNFTISVRLLDLEEAGVMHVYKVTTLDSCHYYASFWEGQSPVDYQLCDGPQTAAAFECGTLIDAEEELVLKHTFEKYLERQLSYWEDRLNTCCV